MFIVARARCSALGRQVVGDTPQTCEKTRRRKRRHAGLYGSYYEFLFFFLPSLLISFLFFCQSEFTDCRSWPRFSRGPIETFGRVSEDYRQSGLSFSGNYFIHHLEYKAISCRFFGIGYGVISPNFQKCSGPLAQLLTLPAIWELQELARLGEINMGRNGKAECACSLYF